MIKTEYATPIKIGDDCYAIVRAAAEIGKGMV